MQEAESAGQSRLGVGQGVCVGVEVSVEVGSAEAVGVAASGVGVSVAAGVGVALAVADAVGNTARDIGASIVAPPKSSNSAFDAFAIHKPMYPPTPLKGQALASRLPTTAPLRRTSIHPSARALAPNRSPLANVTDIADPRWTQPCEAA